MAVVDTDIVFYKSLANAGDGTPSCGGAIDTGSPLTKPAGVLHELFDVITAAEANGSNRMDYRLIYIRNDNVTDTLFAALMDVQTDSSSPSTTIAVGLDPSGHNTPSTITLTDKVDSDDKLVGVTFQTTGSTIDIGDATNNDLASTEFTPVWIRRDLTTPAASTPADVCILRVAGETA